jgi:prefoldin subunit 5
MARAQFVEKAKKPIYKHGKRVEYVSQRGKRAGQTLTKLDRSQPEDENDEILINVGESYYTWCFYGGQPQYSKERPKPSQLTQNWFKQELYSIQEKIEEFEPEDVEDVATFIDEIRDDAESLRDECQEHLDNMPEQLQDSDSGQTLQERIDNLDSVIGDIDNFDSEFESEIEKEDDESNDEFLERQSEEKQQWLDDKTSEIQEFDFNFE